MSICEVDVASQQGVKIFIPWTSRKEDALSLAWGVEPEAIMVTHYFVCVFIHERPTPLSQMRLHKVLKPDFAQEADPLTVSPEVVWQLGCSS